jgi:hypothetical protein
MKLEIDFVDGFYNPVQVNDKVMWISRRNGKQEGKIVKFIVKNVGTKQWQIYCTVLVTETRKVSRWSYVEKRPVETDVRINRKVIFNYKQKEKCFSFVKHVNQS